MHGCQRCAEIEQLLERTAFEHWNVIHHYQGTADPTPDPDMIAKLLAQTKTAMDEAQALYDQHLAVAHPESKTG